MGISVNTNVAATRAGMYLATNHANLQKSLDRLSSGKRITEPADDAGGLAVSMKLDHTSKVLRGVSHNISNAISYLQVQDGILESAGKIVTRMGELQGMATDVTKHEDDIALYESEFNDLREQLYEMTKSKFNGLHLFGDWTDNSGTPQLAADAAGHAFGTDDSESQNSLSVIISEDGTTNVNIHKALLGSALMMSVNGTAGGKLTVAGAAIAGLVKDPAFATDERELDPNGTTPFEAAAFTQAIENIAELRANNGGQVRRLQYQLANVETQITNLTAANGRIMDVDIAAESSNLARQQILVQASAAMTAQANTSNDVALMLLR